MFTDKTVIISGAASGMGLLSARSFAERNANVVLADMNIEAAGEAAAQIRERGGRAAALAVDVRDYAQVKSAVDYAIQNFGGLDIIVNCAGGSARRILEQYDAFADLDIGVIDWALDVNLKGPVYFARAGIGHMIKQKSGVIINIGSVEGETGSTNIEYCTAKSGVMYGLTKSLALYGAPYGVRVCCVSPGPVLTRPAMAKMRTALGRAAQPGEIVDLILYLCSDKAAFITGVNYLIDGGRSCGARD